MKINKINEPVVQLARVQSIVRAVVQVAIVVGGLVGVNTAGLGSEVESTMTSVIVGVGAVWTLTDFVITRVQAWRLRERVTPI